MEKAAEEEQYLPTDHEDSSRIERKMRYAKLLLLNRSKDPPSLSHHLLRKKNHY